MQAQHTCVEESKLASHEIIFIAKALPLKIHKARPRATSSNTNNVHHEAARNLEKRALSLRVFLVALAQEVPKVTGHFSLLLCGLACANVKA